MSSKPVLMIHHITKEIFDLPLEDYILTFDDGTVDHYDYFNQFCNIPTEKKYFIIANKVGKSGYMSVSQIKEILKNDLVSIGGHSFDHIDIRSMKLIDTVLHIKSDTEKMLKWFYKNLEISPVDFCFPYNHDPHGIYKKLMADKGFINFYGRERIPVEKLLRIEPQWNNL